MAPPFSPSSSAVKMLLVSIEVLWAKANVSPLMNIRNSTGFRKVVHMLKGALHELCHDFRREPDHAILSGVVFDSGLATSITGLGAGASGVAPEGSYAFTSLAGVQGSLARGLPVQPLLRALPGVGQEIRPLDASGASGWEKMFVDYCGQTVPVVDRESGRPQETQCGYAYSHGFSFLFTRSFHIGLCPCPSWRNLCLLQPCECSCFCISGNPGACHSRRGFPILDYNRST